MAVDFRQQLEARIMAYEMRTEPEPQAPVSEA
jgi:hypothetical protein